MKHNYEASYYPGEDNERLPEWSVVKWEILNGTTKIGRTVKKFSQSEERAAKSLADALNKNPIWIILDNGDLFEGHQGHWADCFFSNSFEREIRNALENDNFFQTGNDPKPTVVIREMTDEELARFPEALHFREMLLERYGEF